MLVIAELIFSSPESLPADDVPFKWQHFEQQIRGDHRSESVSPLHSLFPLFRPRSSDEENISQRMFV